MVPTTPIECLVQLSVETWVHKLTTNDGPNVLSAFRSASGPWKASRGLGNAAVPTPYSIDLLWRLFRVP